MYTAERVHAWRPDVPGVDEVLHAHFTEHAYPAHTHEHWTLLLVDTGRADIKRKAIADNSLIVLVDSIDEAIAFSNDYAPEHMELMVDHPFEHLGAIRNVGSLFLGPHAPVPVGDYFSGTNHILPTGGAARFSSGLSVETFLRRTTFQHLTADALKRAEGPVRLMAEHEGFGEKHGGAVRVRFAPR